MKIVAATRILNEDDIVEAFVRHTATQVGHHLLLDNGSNDRTIEILAALRREGFPLTVLRNRSVEFCERQTNTILLNAAAQLFHPDWVVFLDADEFITGDRTSLGDELSTVPFDIDVASFSLVNYHTTGGDDVTDLLIPRRLRWRDPVPLGAGKVAVRGGIVQPSISVLNGNHAVARDQSILPDQRSQRMTLAHFMERGAYHYLGKALLGRLKVLAAGEAMERGMASGHYTDFFDSIRDDPARLLHNQNFMRGLNHGMEMIEAPIDYLGGALKYTSAADPLHKMLRALAQGAETLARRHGRLLDEMPMVRAQTQTWNAQLERVM